MAFSCLRRGFNCLYRSFSALYLSRRSISAFSLILLSSDLSLCLKSSSSRKSCDSLRYISSRSMKPPCKGCPLAESRSARASSSLVFLRPSNSARREFRSFLCLFLRRLMRVILFGDVKFFRKSLHLWICISQERTFGCSLQPQSVPINNGRPSRDGIDKL